MTLYLGTSMWPYLKVNWLFKVAQQNQLFSWHICDPTLITDPISPFVTNIWLSNIVMRSLEIGFYINVKYCVKCYLLTGCHQTVLNLIIYAHRLIIRWCGSFYNILSAAYKKATDPYWSPVAFATQTSLELVSNQP